MLRKLNEYYKELVLNYGLPENGLTILILFLFTILAFSFFRSPFKKWNNLSPGNKLILKIFIGICVWLYILMIFIAIFPNGLIK